jgi:hypothetical protein
MAAYRSYLRDDPDFDATNTGDVAPHLPCPPLDPARLELLARFAADAGFGWPPAPVPRLGTDLGRRLDGLARAHGPGQGETFRIRLELAGPGGGDWTLRFVCGHLTAATPGGGRSCDATLAGAAETFAAVLDGRWSLEQALASGTLVLEAAPASLAAASRALGRLAAVGPGADANASNASSTSRVPSRAAGLGACA